MSELPAEAFNQVPTNARVQGFYAEVDPSLAGTFSQNQRALIIGQRLAAGTVAAGVLSLVPGDGSAAKEMFGRGSMLADMVAAFRQNDRSIELWAIALDDDGAGVAATLDLTVTGPATAAGTIALYVGEVRVVVGVASGDDATTIATAIAAAITAKTDLPVTAVSALAVVTITFRHKGEVGNDTCIHWNARGAVGGEALPAGVTLDTGADAYLDGGTTNPDQMAAIAALGEEAFDFICIPYTDGASLDDWDVELADRWGPLRQHYGQVFTCRRGTVSELTTFGATRNDKYTSCMETELPGPTWKRAARYAAQAARSLSNHPVRPLHPLALIGELVPHATQERPWVDRNTLLHGGIATTELTRDGSVLIGRAVTLYQTNSVGDPDDALLDVQSGATVARIIRELRFLVYQRFIERRAILIDDGTPIAGGIPYATPRLIRATLVAHYDRLQNLGLAERREAFEQLLLVERDEGDPTRINIRYTPDLANPLHIIAAQVGFSLQWPADLLRVS